MTRRNPRPRHAAHPIWPERFQNRWELLGDQYSSLLPLFPARDLLHHRLLPIIQKIQHRLVLVLADILVAADPKAAVELGEDASMEDLRHTLTSL